VTDAIGDTPIVQLRRLPEMRGVQANILAKLEYLNPLGSVKDRIGVSMIDATEAAGLVGPGTVLIEPTSGNTGIALAFVAAARGYRLILVMPESMSLERRQMLRLLGAELVLTPAALGMKGAVTKAEEILKATKNGAMPQQFKNPTNPEVHRQITAEEIWKRRRRRDRRLRSGRRHRRHNYRPRTGLEARKNSLRVVAVERRTALFFPAASQDHIKFRELALASFPTYSTGRSSTKFTADNQAAFDTARALACYEGILAGISSGAVVAAAFEIGKRPRMSGKNIAVILASSAERYQSTPLFDEL
jgi:cysteine synthase A